MSQLTKQVNNADQLPFVMKWAQAALEKALPAGPALLVLTRPSK